MISRRAFCITASAAIAGSACAQPQQAMGGSALRLTAPRAAYSMVALADGSALMMGGCVANSCETGPASATVDRYDPATRSIRAAGRLGGPRTEGAALVMPDQSVLVAGGWAGPRRTASVESFDPQRGVSQVVGELAAAQICTAVRLPDGRALFVGDRSIEAWNPAQRKMQVVTDASPYRESSTATLLADGRVLVAGGGLPAPPTDEAWLFDPATGRSVRVGALSAPRRKHAAVRLLDGRVLIVGGSGEGDRDDKTRVLEVYDPASARFSIVGQTRDARFKIADAAVLLGDGRVLVAGGAETPELIDPATWRSRPLDVSLGAMLNFSCAVRLAAGDVLVAGGYGERTIDPVDRAWLIPRSALV